MLEAVERVVNSKLDEMRKLLAEDLDPAKETGRWAPPCERCAAA